MRFVRTLLFVGLGLSIGLNILLWMKNEKTRTQFRVGDHKITKKEYHDWLEQHHGRAMQAAMIQYYLITDEARKAGVMPSDAEVDKEVTEQLDAQPQLASKLTTQPWLRKDLKQDVELKLALFNLSTRNIKVTDDQIKSFYETLGASQFDEPTVDKIRLIGFTDPKPANSAEIAAWNTKKVDYLNRAKELIDSMAQRAKAQQPSPGVVEKPLPDLDLVKQQLAPHIGTVPTPLLVKSTEGAFADIAGLKAGESKITIYPQLDKVLVYVERRSEGKKSSITDPDTRKKVERAFKASQQVNAQQTLRELWDKTEVQTDPESAKPEIESMIVPERAKQIARSGK